MEEFLLQILLLIFDVLLLDLQELQLLLQFLEAQSKGLPRGLAVPEWEEGGSNRWGPPAGPRLGLNTPCSGCTGPPSPQVQVPGRTGQSAAETQTVLGSHPGVRKQRIIS